MMKSEEIKSQVSILKSSTVFINRYITYLKYKNSPIRRALNPLKWSFIKDLWKDCLDDANQCFEVVLKQEAKDGKR